MTDSTVKRMQEEINSKYETFNKNINTQRDESMNKSILEKENLKVFYKTTNTFRVQLKDNCSLLYKQRENLRADLIKLKDTESLINELMQNPNSDYSQCIPVYQEAKEIYGVNPKLVEKFFSFISNKKDEDLKGEIKKLTAKDKNLIQKHLEEIKEHKLNVSHDVLARLNELMNEEIGKKK